MLTVGVVAVAATPIIMKYFVAVLIFVCVSERLFMVAVFLMEKIFLVSHTCYD